MSRTPPYQQRPARLRRPEPLYSLTQGVGWFSLALGAVEVVAPDLLARKLGMRGQERLIQSYGAREIVSGIGILTSRDPTPWLWSRLVGDVLDVATLAFAAKGNRKTDNLAVAAAAVIGVGLLDVALAGSSSGRKQKIVARRPSYRRRHGYPRGGVQGARGAAKDFTPPDDFRVPEPLRPWGE